MTYCSNLTKERILSCAKTEFIAVGFIKANMRTIAENANVTTGAMYNHFKNKEILFESIVGEVATNVLGIFEKGYTQCEQSTAIFDESTRQIFSKTTPVIYAYIYEHLEEIKLLTSNTTGTKYEHFLERLIEIEERSILCMLSHHNIETAQEDLFFIHVLSTTVVQNMFEPVHHGLNKIEALMYIEQLHKFHYAGWKEILGR